MPHGLHPHPNDFLTTAEFVSCRAIWCSVMETQTYPHTHTPVCTFLPCNPDTLPCFHAPPLLTTRGAKNRWQYDKKGWKRRNRRKGWGRESKETQSSSKMRGGRDEEKKKNKIFRTKQQEEKRAENEKEECDVLSPGCQAEPNSVLLAV